LPAAEAPVAMHVELMKQNPDKSVHEVVLPLGIHFWQLADGLVASEE